MRWRLSIAYLARGERPSRLSRFFALAWLPLILVVSLYPFHGWRFTGEPIFAFLFYPLPHYQTVFDNAINALAYLPLACTLTLGWRCRWWAGPLAILSSALLSVSVEFIQQFLPERVSSNLDLLANSAGAVLGAALAYILHHWQLSRRLLLWRQQWFQEGDWTDFGLTLAALWFFTQLDPSVPILGSVVVPNGLPQPFVSPLADPALFLRLLESSATLLNLLGVGLFVAVLQASRRQAGPAILLWLAAALLVKLVAAGMLLKPTQFFAWVNSNVAYGAGGGGLLLLMMLHLQRGWQALMAALALAASQVVAALWPLLPVWSATLQLFKWRYGHLLHLSGLAEIVSEWWPYVAMLFLLGVVWQEWRRATQPPEI